MPTVRKQTPTVSRNKSQSVVDRIAPLGEGLDEGIKIALYGRSGTGKTTLWASFPKPILSIICSGGNKPGEVRSILTPENRKTIKQVSIASSNELGELTEYVGGANFATVVLDHVSGLQDVILKEVVGLEEIPAQLGWGVAKQQDWGQVGLQIKERLRALLSLPRNVVIIAQEREFNVDAESALLAPYVGAGLTPSAAGWLNTAVDYICQTFIRQKTTTVETKIGAKTVKTTQKAPGVEYCLRTAPDPVYTTKFRIPKGRPLPTEIVDPSYDKIIKLING